MCNLCWFEWQNQSVTFFRSGILMEMIRQGTTCDNIYTRLLFFTTLPETNIAPEKKRGWKISFLWGCHLVTGYVSCREASLPKSRQTPNLSNVHQNRVVPVQEFVVPIPKCTFPYVAHVTKTIPSQPATDGLQELRLCCTAALQDVWT